MNTSFARRILVVDDNVDLGDSLVMLLQLKGHSVRVATDGLAALEAVQDHPPDLVFLDICMPGMDGHEVARRLRQNPLLQKTVLVAMTGFSQEEDRRRSREAGFDYHLVKPVEPEVLLKLVKDPQRADL
jgi:two-component system CheB/CheR fusion protein